jgi:hypothetical protein
MLLNKAFTGISSLRSLRVVIECYLPSYTKNILMVISLLEKRNPEYKCFFENWAWWYISIIPTLEGRGRGITSSRSPWAT